jgi:hypothetical protein
MAKKRGSGRLSGKKCETPGTPFQENTLGAKGQGANMLTTFPVSFTWSLKIYISNVRCCAAYLQCDEWINSIVFFPFRDQRERTF